MPSLKGQEEGYNTAELHLSRLTGTVNILGMQKIQITGFFFENRLQWQFEVEKCFYTWLF
jgi:hypothetical protein